MKNTETEFGENKRVALLSQRRGKQARSSRTVCLSHEELGGGGDYIDEGVSDEEQTCEGLVFFFLLDHFKNSHRLAIR